MWPATPSKVNADATVTLPAMLIKDRGLHLACSIQRADLFPLYRQKAIIGMTVFNAATVSS